MKKVKFHVLIALCAMMLGLNFTSCKKEIENEEQQPTEEFTVIGNWKSWNYQWIDGEDNYMEATSHYSVVFTKSTATLHLYFDGFENTIESNYSFKETDDSIIYFSKAYEDYGYMIVGQVFKDKKELIIEVRHEAWDYFERYYFAKQ